MSTFEQVLHTMPPSEQISQLTYRRDELLRASQLNRAAAQQRLNELTSWKLDGAIAEDYDIENDHRLHALLGGAETWEQEALSVQSKLETAMQTMGISGVNIRGPVRSAVKH